LFSISFFYTTGRLGNRGSVLCRGKRFVSSAQRLDRLWGPPTLIQWGSEVKRPEHEADHSASSGSQVMNAWSFTSTAHIFMTSFLIKHKENLIFTFPAFLQFSSGLIFFSSSHYHLPFLFILLCYFIPFLLSLFRSS
jgi:hypothetical protein